MGVWGWEELVGNVELLGKNVMQELAEAVQATCAHVYGRGGGTEWTWEGG